jgi:PKD repeat protein
MQIFKGLTFLLSLVLLMNTESAYAQCIANAGADTSICFGASAQIGGIPAVTGNGPFTYLWSPATGLNDATLPNPVVTATVNQVYTLTVTDADGDCTDQVSVTVDAVPAANFIINGNNGCANIPIQFTNTSTGTGLTYSWNFGDPTSGSANTSNAVNPVHLFNAFGAGSQNYTVTLVVTNAAGCTHSISQTVTINRIPNPALIDPISDMRNCDGTNFNMTVFDASATSSVSNYTIQWGDGSPDFNSPTFPGAGLSHTYSSAQIFNLVYIVTGTNGCADTTTYNVANITNPAIGAANPGATTGCGPITLCFPLSNYSANHPTTYYVVDYGDGSPRDTLAHPPPTSICHTYTTSSCGQPGNAYVFKMTAINLCDSSFASISPIRVYTGPEAHFNATPTTACVNTNILFQNTTITGFNTSCSANAVYQWNFGDGNTLTTATLTSPSHAYTAPGTYSVTLTVTNSCGTSSETHTVCIEVPPVPSFTLSPNAGCIPFITTCTDASTFTNTCNVTRVWTVLFNGSPCTPGTGSFSFVGGTNASSVNPQIQFNNSGNYTVRLTLTNSCGSFTFDRPVTAQKIPQISVNALTSICANTSASPVGVVNDCLESVDSYAWTFTGGVPASASTLVPGSVTYPAAGTFPVQFSATNACGTSTATTNIIIRPLPPVLNATVNTPICVGQAANFSSDPLPGGTYSWTNPVGTVVSNTQTFTIPSATLANAGNYTVTGTLNGCVGPPSTVNLVVNPIPVVTVDPPSATICTGGSVILTASGASSFTWSPNINISSTVGNPVTVNPTTTQTYNVVGMNGTCSGSANVTITVNPLPVVNAGADTTVCDQPIPFQLGGVSPAGGTWSGPNVSPSGQFTPAGAGTFTITYSFTNANGCTNTDSRVVTVISPTLAVAGSDIQVCLGSPNVTLNGTPAGGTWTGTNVTGGGIFSPITLGTYDLVYTFGAGACINRDTLVATVVPLPVVDAGPNFTVCIDAGIQILNGTPPGGTWTGAGITNPTGEFTPASAGTGTFTLTYSYTDGVTGCSNNDVLTAIVNPLPVVNAGIDTTVCNQPIPFQVWSTPAGGTWSGTDITAGGIFTPNGTGTFTVTYSFTNANGCTNTDSRIITVNNPVIPNAGNDFSVCIDAPNVILAPTPTGGTWSGPNVTTGGIYDPTVVATEQLVYTVGGGSCLQRDTLLVTVNPLPIVDAGADITNCISVPTVNLNGTPAGGTWTGTGVTDPAGVFSPPTSGAGTFNLTYTYTEPVTGCTASDFLVSVVNPLPVVNAGNDTTLCDQPFPIQINGTPAAGTWSGPNVTPAGVFTPNGTGTFNLTYSFTNGNGCTNTDVRIVTVNAPIQPNAGNDFALCIDAPNAALTPAPTGGTWTGPGVTSGGIFDPTIAGAFSLVYSLGSGNCLLTDTLLVTVNPLPIVDAGADITNCISVPTVNLNGTPAGGAWTGTGVTDPAGVFSPPTSGAGTFNLTYTYTEPVTGCTASDFLVSVVNPLPVVNAGNDTTLCDQPFPVQINGTPAAGTWSGPNVTPAGVFTPNGTGTFNLTYSFTNGNGCTNTDVRVVTVNAPIQPNAGNDFALCIDAPNAALTPAPTGGTWTGPGVTSGGIFDPIIAGTFSLVYSFGTGNCLLTDTLLVTVNPLPVVDAGTDFTVCIDAGIQNLNGTPAGGTWTGTGISNPAGQFNPVTSGAGTFNLTYTYTNPATGCTSSDFLTATVNPLPAVNAGVDTTLCNQPFPVQFTGTPAGGTWSGANVTATGVFTPSGTGNTTLTYTVTSALGCSNSDTRIVTVVNPVPSNAGTDQAACIDAPNVVLNGTPASGTWSGTDVTSGGIFNPTTAGTFTLVLSNGAGNCLMRDTLLFTVNPLPIVNAGPNADFCPSDAPVNFSGTPVGGTWSGTGITNTASGTFDPAVAPVGNHNIAYTFTDPVTGCLNRDTLLATVHPFPTANFTFNPIICAGAATTLTNTSTLGSTYDWEFGDGGTSAATSPSHTYAAEGFYDIEVVVTSAFGCLDSITHQIEVRVPPVADFTLSPDSACAPVLVSFTDLSTGPSLTYSWNYGNGNTSSAAVPVNQTYNQGVLADTTYTITLQLTNFCGTSTHQETVVAMPSPTAIFGTATDVACSPVDLEIVNNSLGLPDTYYWDFGDGSPTSNTSAATLTHQFTTGVNDTIYTITLAVTNECGTDTAQYNIHVLPNQVNAFFNTSITSGCVPLTVDFTQFSQGSTVSNWDFDDGNVSSAYSPTHTFTTSGTYTVQLFANDGCGYDTASVVITVNPSPVVAFNSSPDSVCINDLFTFQNQSVGLASSTWAFGDGDSSFLTNPTHAYIASGTYIVTLTGVSQTNGCTASVSHPIVVSTNPVAAFTMNPDSGCVPLTVSFLNNSTNTDFQSWNFGDGNLSTAVSPTHIYTSAGNYTVTLYVENANGCYDSLQQTVTVYPLPVADFSYATTNPCVQPMDVTFTNNSTGALSYEWFFGDGQTSALTNPQHSYADDGIYDVELVATNLYGCTDTFSVQIQSYLMAAASFTLPNDSICVGEPVMFNSTSSNALNLSWDFGDGTILTGSTVSYSFPGSGTFPVTLIAYGAGGCNDTVLVNQPIVVMPNPVADFDFENIQNPDPLSGTVVFTNTSQGADYYYWEFGNGNSSEEVDPIERYNQYGEFEVMLVATTEFGCIDTTFQTVAVDFFYGLFIPNAMSPGHSDFEVSNFIPKGVGLKTFELLIYDDWGNLIWSTTALDADGRPTEYWDGTFRGEPVQQDAYVWKATATFLNEKVWEGKDYNKGVLKRSGTVTVIR